MTRLFERERTVHLCIDVQQLFGPQGAWAAPWMDRVLPQIVDIAGHFDSRNVFTRFIPPQDAEDCGGMWKAFYRKWPHVTRSRLPAQQLDLMPELQRWALPGQVFDKTTYSAFHDQRLHPFLTERQVTTLVVTGTETDVCVLSSVLDAVDYGYRIILVEDALCSSSDTGHDALMTMYRQRLGTQIELTTARQVVEAFRTAL